jgi:hypothetical protein
MMKRVMTILAMAVLTSTLLASAAEARGFGGGGNVEGFVGSVHLGGGYGGGMGRVGGEHAMRRLTPGHASNCYYPDEAPKAPPWPPFCD